MKSFLAGFASCAIIVLLTAGTVERVSRYFSPRLMAAQSLVLLDQVNTIRSKLSPPLGPISTNQMVTAITAKYQDLTDEFHDLENPEP